MKPRKKARKMRPDDARFAAAILIVFGLLMIVWLWVKLR